MAFFQLILKARTLNNAKVKYMDEKLNSIDVSRGTKPRYALGQKLRHRKILLKRKIKKWLDKTMTFPETSWFHKKSVLLRTDGTFENFILKSILGFLGGIFLTYMFFMFFVFQLNFTLSSATMLCSIFGIILTIGLAFSYRVRCVVFLLLPQFFSKRGRQALMAYAFILALTGPAKNTLHNTGVLSESLACGQERLKDAVKAIVDLIKQPFYALRDAISKVIRTIKVVVKKIKESLLAIKRIILSILRIIKAVFQWLGSIVNICNKKLGTPFERCQKVFDGAVADCKANLGPLFGGICNLAYIVGLVCYVVKPLDFICMLVSFVADTIVGTVRKKMKKFIKHMKAMFYVKVKFSHSFHFESNQSQSLNEVTTGIITEIRSRTDKFLTVFDWMSFATSFFILFLLLRVIHYRYKWLTNERFDNRYLTNDLREIDLKRARTDKETVLPLNPRERNKYIPLTSIVLIRSEKIKLTKSAVFLCLTTFKLCIHMMADYSLYWVLSTIRYHGRFQSKVQAPNSVGVYVAGNGYLAELYRSIVRAFTPMGEEMQMDTMPCLPDPVPPDLDRYTQIVSLIVLCWIMAIFEPYGLRLRHVVMCYYHPERARQRAAWLYNHIIRSRGSFLKFARRQLRRKYGMADSAGIEKITLRDRLAAKCPIINRLCPKEENLCLLCGSAQRDNQIPHIKCPTPGCVGLFCVQCFSDLQNLCTICMSPLDYGDLSDMSEEKDSSEDEALLERSRQLREKMNKYRAERKYKDKDEDITEMTEEEQGIKIEEEEETEMKDKQKEEEDKKKTKDEGEIISKPKSEYIELEDLEKSTDKVSTDKSIREDEHIDKKAYERKIDKSEEPTLIRDIENPDWSSSSIYSYTYQDESPDEVEFIHQRIPFRDVETQKIRDDVTTQVFNEPLIVDESSTTDDEDCGLLVRATRKLRSRKCKISTSSTPNDRSTSSTSIADTESLSTEEIEEEEVIQIEVLDNRDEHELLEKNEAKKKRNRIKKVMAALSRISWIGKRASEDTNVKNESPEKKSTLMNKIVNMLQTKHPNVPVQSYKRVRRLKKNVSAVVSHSSILTSSSSLSSCVDDYNEKRSLLRKNEIGSSEYVARSRRKKAREIRHLENSDKDYLYFKSNKAHQGHGLSSKGSPRRYTKESCKYPYERKFIIKKMPSYLKPVAKETFYAEVNEKELPFSLNKSINTESLNKSTDAKTSTSDIGVFKSTWNIIDNVKQSDIQSSSMPTTYEENTNRMAYSMNMSTIEEGTDETSRNDKTESEDVSSPIETDEYVDITGTTSLTSDSKVNSRGKKRKMCSRKCLKKPGASSKSTTVEYTESTERHMKSTSKKRKIAIQEEMESANWSSQKEWQWSLPNSKLSSNKLEPENTTMVFETDLKKKEDGQSKIIRSTLYDSSAELKRPTIKEQSEAGRISTSDVRNKQENIGKEQEVQRSLEIQRFSDIPEDVTKKSVHQNEHNVQELQIDNKLELKVDKATDAPAKTEATQTKFQKSKQRIDTYDTEDSSTEISTTSRVRRNVRKYNKTQKRKKHSQKKIHHTNSYDEYHSEPESCFCKMQYKHSHRSTLTDEEISPKKERRKQNEELCAMKWGRKYKRNRHRERTLRDRHVKHIRYEDEQNYYPEQRHEHFVPEFKPMTCHGSGDNPPYYNLRQGVDYEAARNYDYLRHRHATTNNEWYNPKKDNANENVSTNMNDYFNRYDYYNHNQHPGERGSSRYHPREEYRVPMYIPMRPNTIIPESGRIIHSRRYPRPKDYKEDTDPYYGVSYHINRRQQDREIKIKAEKKRIKRKEAKKSVVEECRKKYAIPMLEKFLPLFQKPELIEELKEHDKIKLIQEREAKERKAGGTQTSDHLLIASEMKDQGTGINKTLSKPLELESSGRLPYQETQAFKDVIHEYKRKRISDILHEDSEEMKPLIKTYQHVDDSREIKQLFPTQDKNQREPNSISRMSKKIINAFKSNKSKPCKCPEEINLSLHQKSEGTIGESLTEISTSCQEEQEDISTDLISFEDITDNNETSQ